MQNDCTLLLGFECEVLSSHENIRNPALGRICGAVVSARAYRPNFLFKLRKK